MFILLLNNCESMILHKTLMAFALYKSFFEFISFISELVIMMTSSDDGEISLIHKYTIRRNSVSLC